MPISPAQSTNPWICNIFFLLDVDVYYARRWWWWKTDTGHVDDEDQHHQPGLRSKQVEGEYKGWGPGGTCLAHPWWKTLVRPKDSYHLLFFVEAQVCKYFLFCYKVNWTSFKKDALHKVLQKITCGISSLAIIWGPRFSVEFEENIAGVVKLDGAHTSCFLGQTWAAGVGKIHLQHENTRFGALGVKGEEEIGGGWYL